MLTIWQCPTCIVCSSIQTQKSPRSRKQSTAAELGSDANNHHHYHHHQPSSQYHPASALMSRSSHRRHRAPPFLKRYTIADFANTRAYQESTASLISASAEHGTFTSLLCHAILLRLSRSENSFSSFSFRAR